MSRFLGVFSVTAMVMGDDGQTACCSETCESFVSTVVLAQSVENLKHTLRIAGRQPKRPPNGMLIGRREFKRLSLYVGHSDTQ